MELKVFFVFEAAACVLLSKGLVQVIDIIFQDDLEVFLFGNASVKNKHIFLVLNFHNSTFFNISYSHTRF